MKLSDIKYKANYFALLVLGFVIPLDRRLIAPAIILFFISSVLNSSFRFKERKKVLWFTSIYLLYLVSLFLSNNTSVALNDLTTKLSLLILPLSFFFSNLNFRKSIIPLFKSLIDGCLAVIILSVFNAIVIYYYSLDVSKFFYEDISIYMHPSYLAMILNMCVIAIYYFVFKPNSDITFTNKKAIFLILIFSVFTLILSSKTGLLTLLITHGFFIGYWILKKKEYTKGIIVFVLFGSSIGLTYKFSGVFKSRINELFTINTTKDVNTDSSTIARKEIWIIAIDLIKENPIIGYGNGDAKEILVSEYKKRGFEFLLKKELNAHNQFLQTTLSLGIIGFLILFAMLFFPLFFSFKEKHYLYLAFILLTLVNYSTESMLERQVGVVFYALLNGLLFKAYFIESNKEEVN